jgi:hypothetical protein
MISDRECSKHTRGEGRKALEGPARTEVLQVTVAVLTVGR